MQAPPQHARFNTYHGPKRQLLGNQSGHAPPAWRNGANANIPANPRKASGPSELGSKILLSRLPADVTENEVEVLFAKTVGPVKESFVVYNSQGRSKGMAVVAFQRVGDAAVARAKYNGKIIDGRRPIKIEIVIDDDERPAAAHPSHPAAKPQAPSLLDRISLNKTALPTVGAPSPQSRPRKTPPAKKNAPPGPIVPAPRAVKQNPKRRLRTKKPPKRLMRAAVTVADLDKEMEDYRATADGASS